MKPILLLRKYYELHEKILKHYGLTNQETEIALYVINGLSYCDIAQLMALTESTVKFHSRNIFKKCRVKGKNEFCLMMFLKSHTLG